MAMIGRPNLPHATATHFWWVLVIGCCVLLQCEVQGFLCIVSKVTINGLLFKMEQPEVVQEFQPRPYQICLFERVQNENSIIYLPTGSGKTFIAVLLVKHLSGQVQKAYTEGGKRTVFIVNTVALVIQQCAFLNRHTGLVCKSYTGDMQVDVWDSNQWHSEIESCQVLVMTAQIFLNMVTQGVLPLSRVNLLIFDECHRAVKDHPMRQIMQRFQECPDYQHPRVLAMTASLLNSNVKLNKIAETLKELEVTFHSKIITVQSLQTITDFSVNPKEFVDYVEPLRDSTVFHKVNNIIDEAKSILNVIEIPNKMENKASSVEFRPVSKNVKLQRILTDIQTHLEDMGLYGGSKSVLLHMIQLEYIKKYSDEPKIIAILEYLTTQLMKIQKLLSLEIENVPTLELINEHSSPKVSKLVKILKTFHDTQVGLNKFCCIIFVQRRFTAKVLYHMLKKLSEYDNYKFLKAEYIIGYNNDPYKNAKEALVLSEWNKKVLTRFRNGTINCIIATDVVDEGIDIPSCTLVVRYYAPPDFRSYIQSKGRARYHTSYFVILASSQEDYVKKYKTFQDTERFLQNALYGFSNRTKPTQDEIDNILYDYTIQPYEIIHEDGHISVITEQNAIALINVYCTSLLKSKFISLTPTWVKEEIVDNLFGKQYRVHLTLPIMSTVKEVVVSDKYNALDVAKRSAAVKACIKLYTNGELDKNLQPKKMKDAISCDYLFPYMEKEEHADIQPGTNSRKRRHSVVHPKALLGAYPVEDLALFLHIIEMKPNYAMPSNENRHLVFYKLLASKNTYGILSTKKLPEIPSFPIFMNVGDLHFHWLLFNDILQLTKDFMVFDTENKDNSFLIVPVDEKEQINWDIVKRYKSVEHTLPAKPIVVKKSEYEHILVVPDYRAANEYIVTEVCEYLRAESRFPTADYESYIHYFKDRHGLQIECHDQPMLEVKPITKKINFIKPRKLKANMSKRKRANITEDFEEHMVPELCKKIEFPALYWLKATTLPSIIHRIKQLLVAIDLRDQIAEEACLSLETRKPEKKYEALWIKDNKDYDIDSSKETNLDDTTLEDDEVIVGDPLDIDAVSEVDILSEERSHFTWMKEREPLDLERYADRVQMIDIEAYYQFMSDVTATDRENLKYQNVVKCDYIFATDEQAPALEMLVKTNGYGPSPLDVLESLTAKMSNDMFNYERVETLGDSFLKFAVSLYLFQNYPDSGEGPLSHLKGKLVGNLNLFYCARAKNLPGRMNVEEFSPENNFAVPAFGVENSTKSQIVKAEVSASVLYDIRIPQQERISGELSDYTKSAVKEKLLAWESDTTLQTGREHFLDLHVLSDKTASDGVEAVIGMYLLHLGVEGALSVVKWFDILPKTLDATEYLHAKVTNPQLAPGNINEHMPWAGNVEKRIGYQFRNRAFLLQAFTHPSFVSNRVTNSYQRLEFLGDAVLDFLLTVHIFEQCGNLSPGELTDLRSALVNNITFACLAVRYALHTALLAYAPKMFDIIDRFVQFQENRKHEVNDELLWVLLEEDDCQMAEHVDVPKVLGDIYESVIGAVFLDCGKDLQITWRIIYNLMKKEIDLFSKNVPKQPIRVIYETQGANPKFSKSLQVEGSTAIMVTLSIFSNGQQKFFHGFGSTKKLAKCAAAKQALKYLRYKKNN
ncbi:endoribonuclease Dicer isoform X1 [Phymastichus coffea]|uniref:endoribonuclease Dicer isoform X1 n=1 Tax=Phymastichus coffea TaxID=108790 RepID=UPI00273B67D0|nr:endoribonuclease Dicer isoform X1 [Phymastichus coffea]